MNALCYIFTDNGAIEALLWLVIAVALLVVLFKLLQKL
jgi:hypothetical protein